MGKWEDTEEAYYMGKENKVMEDENQTGFAQALIVLHEISDHAELMGMYSYVDAFNAVFRWIDEMVLLLHKIGGK